MMNEHRQLKPCCNCFTPKQNNWKIRLHKWNAMVFDMVSNFHSNNKFCHLTPSTASMTLKLYHLRASETFHFSQSLATEVKKTHTHTLRHPHFRSIFPCSMLTAHAQCTNFVARTTHVQQRKFPMHKQWGHNSLVEVVQSKKPIGIDFFVQSHQRQNHWYKKRKNYNWKGKFFWKRKKQLLNNNEFVAK